jgi:hypothetical protein
MKLIHHLIKKAADKVNLSAALFRETEAFQYPITNLAHLYLHISDMSLLYRTPPGYLLFDHARFVF